MWCLLMAAIETGNHSEKTCIGLNCKNRDSNDKIPSTLANSSWSILVPKGNAKEMDLSVQAGFPPLIFVTDIKKKTLRKLPVAARTQKPHTCTSCCDCPLSQDSDPSGHLNTFTASPSLFSLYFSLGQESTYLKPTPGIGWNWTWKHPGTSTPVYFQWVFMTYFSPRNQS